MAIAIKHVTKINTLRLKKLAEKFHNLEVSLCLEKIIWAKRDGTIKQVIQIWCSDCGYDEGDWGVERFIERHGGE